MPANDGAVPQYQKSGIKFQCPRDPMERMAETEAWPRVAPMVWRVLAYFVCFVVILEKTALLKMMSTR